MTREQRAKRSAAQIQQNTKKRFQHAQWIALYLAAYDVIAVTLAYFLALWLRFDGMFSLIPAMYLEPWKSFAPFYAVICLLVFAGCRLYNSIWRFASFKELQRVTIATLITTILHIILITALLQRMPISYYMMGAVFQCVFIVGIRFSYRFILLLRSQKAKADADRCMMIGAGAAGQVVLRELRRTAEITDKVVCIIDDNPNKWGRTIDGIPIVGGREEIAATVEKYNVSKIYLAIPSLSAKERKAILEICKETGCELKTLPGLYQA